MNSIIIKVSLLTVLTIGMIFSLSVFTTSYALACDDSECWYKQVAQYEPIESEPLEPETESLNSISETPEQASEPIGSDIAPTEPLNAVSETAGQASESVDSLTEPTESLDSVSENLDQASETIDAVSETADEASEELPFAPEGEETTLDPGDPVEKPLGVREAEGRVIGE